MKFKLTTELYFLKYKKNYIAYAPLERKCFLIDDFAKKILSKLKKEKIVNPEPITKALLKHYKGMGLVNGKKHKYLKKTPIDWKSPEYKYLPAHASILPTLNCNLSCLYCFSKSGEKKTNLDLEVALAAVDFIIKNCLKKKSKEISIGFSGGGEPTLNWNLIVETVKYARKLTKDNKLSCEISLTTNGILSQKKLNWIIKNIDRVYVSFDGLKEIQNLHRPLANGKDSFNKVFKTIKKLDKINFNYKIKGVITNKNIDKLPETMEFLYKNLKIRNHQFGLFYPCQKSRENNLTVPPPKRYYQMIDKTIKRTRELGGNFDGSYEYFFSRLQKFDCQFYKNFVLTPEGYVSSCAFVDKKSDPRSKDFFIGKYDYKRKKFLIDENKRRKMILRTMENLPNCQTCYAKWHCCGGCAAQVALQTGDMFKTKGFNLCKNVKYLIRKGLIDEIENRSV